MAGGGKSLPQNFWLQMAINLSLTIIQNLHCWRSHLPKGIAYPFP
jgi:hypothetical protein